MNCIRCGRTTAEGGMFCAECVPDVSKPLEESEYMKTRVILPERKALGKTFPRGRFEIILGDCGCGQYRTRFFYALGKGAALLGYLFPGLGQKLLPSRPFLFLRLVL